MGGRDFIFTGTKNAIDDVIDDVIDDAIDDQ